MELLFSYGTLQLEQVQLDNFGRKLKGAEDRLAGYWLDTVRITDDEVLESSGISNHPIARESGNPGDVIEGMVFELTREEILRADVYEAEDYKRIEVTLGSGRKSWVYVAA